MINIEFTRKVSQDANHTVPLDSYDIYLYSSTASFASSVLISVYRPRLQQTPTQQSIKTIRYLMNGTQFCKNILPFIFKVLINKACFYSQEINEHRPTLNFLLEF